MYALAIWSQGDFKFEPRRRHRAAARSRRATPTCSWRRRAASTSGACSRRRSRPRTMIPEFVVQEHREGQINLNTSEWLILSKIDGQRSIKQMAAASGLSVFDVAKILYGLVATALIRLRDPGPAAARGRPPPRPRPAPRPRPRGRRARRQAAAPPAPAAANKELLAKLDRMREICNTHARPRRRERRQQALPEGQGGPRARRRVRGHPGGDHPDRAGVVDPQGPRDARHPPRAAQGCPLSPSPEDAVGRASAVLALVALTFLAWFAGMPPGLPAWVPLAGGDASSRARGFRAARRHLAPPVHGHPRLPRASRSLYRAPALVHPWGWVNRDGAYGAFVGMHLRRGLPPGARLHRGRELPGHAEGAPRGRALAARHRRLVVPDRPGRASSSRWPRWRRGWRWPATSAAGAAALFAGLYLALPPRFLAVFSLNSVGQYVDVLALGRHRAGARRAGRRGGRRPARVRRPARRRGSSSGPRSGSSRSRCRTCRGGFVVLALRRGSGRCRGRSAGIRGGRAARRPLERAERLGERRHHGPRSRRAARPGRRAAAAAAPDADHLVPDPGRPRARAPVGRHRGGAAGRGRADPGRRSSPTSCWRAAPSSRPFARGPPRRRCCRRCCCWPRSRSPGPPRPARCTGGRGTCCRWSPPPRSTSASCSARLWGRSRVAAGAATAGLLLLNVAGLAFPPGDGTTPRLFAGAEIAAPYARLVRVARGEGHPHGLQRLLAVGAGDDVHRRADRALAAPRARRRHMCRPGRRRWWRGWVPTPTCCEPTTIRRRSRRCSTRSASRTSSRLDPVPIFYRLSRRVAVEEVAGFRGETPAAEAPDGES